MKEPRGTKGLLPGESRRRSLVTVEKFAFHKDQADQYGRLVENYIVTTRRMEKEWSHVVEFQGETWALPGAVVERMLRHREAIISQERSQRARERILRQAQMITEGRGH